MQRVEARHFVRYSGVGGNKNNLDGMPNVDSLNPHPLPLESNALSQGQADGTGFGTTEIKIAHACTNAL